ncbi:MAG TPA: tail fiber domain-containing protein [Longimicrobiales bacterium]|nr:tail fiber domain-containing protein [Longimicrobiales bacterium]
MRRAIDIPCFVQALLLTGGGLAPLAAQSVASEPGPAVFHACYVPGTGTVYRIREIDLKQSCASRGHVEFSWTDAATALGPSGERRPTAGVTDHGLLTGLDDDDHPHYFRTDGARAFGGEVSAGGFRITNLAAGTEAGDALRFDQALKVGDVAEGDLTGALPGPTVAKLRGRSVAETAPADGQVLAWHASAQQWQPTTPATGGTGGTGDHGALAGLIDDDHPQYLLTNGSRSVTGPLNVSGPASLAGGGVVAALGNLQARSATIGTGSTGSGNGSLAAGQNAHASGEGALALGLGAVASGARSVALLSGANATAQNALAAGPSALASAQNAVAIGRNAIASSFDAVAIGAGANASGTGSIAMGAGARTSARVNAITIAATSSQLFAGRDNELAALAPGGIRMLTGSSTGCFINAGAGTWTCTSDRNAKTGFADIDGSGLLAKLAAMPIQSWSYKMENGVRHIGPTAQDFRAAFGLGASDTDIGLVDVAGVALAGVQQLGRDVRALSEENRQLRARLASLEERLSRFEEGR